MQVPRVARKALGLPASMLQKAVDYFVHVLTVPRKHYSASEVSNVRSIKSRIKPGDVLLVGGNARISYVVKILTLSPWSHVVMYVGDRTDLLSDEEVEEWTAAFGKSSLKHLVIDSDPVRRVHLKPLDEYAGSMIRHCRPEALSWEDRERVIDAANSQLGREYDIKHIIRLLFFFAFPWEMLPQGLRRIITDFTLSEDDRICSRVLSEAFHSVGYPIRPTLVLPERSKFHYKALGVLVGLRHRSRSAAKLLMGGRLKSAVSRMADRRYAEIHLKGARHITPADYDLSRFFSIIKDENDLKIRYKEARAVCPVTMGES